MKTSPLCFILKKMKKKELEIFLQRVPSFKKPLPQLEQYKTSAHIAADIIFTAHQFGDIHDKTVLDLGCGTGIFAVGAAITGARKVIGVDIDKNSIDLARTHAKKQNLNITFLVADIKEISIKADTVIMNPPFGAQKSNLNADSVFLKNAIQFAPVIYSLHLTKTVPFIEKILFNLEREIVFKKNYRFPIKWMFEFHEKPVSYYDVSLLRITEKQ